MALKKAAKKKVATKVQAKKKPNRQKTAPQNPANRPSRSSAAKRKPAVRKAANSAAPRTAKTAKLKRASEPDAFDLRGIPAESLVDETRGVCLACGLRLMTGPLGLSAERARTELRRYIPTIEELVSPNTTAPYVAWPATECLNCGATAKWIAPLRVARIEGGKATDSARRALVKALGDSANFAVLEEKSTERDAVYHWLAKTGESLDLDSADWLLEAARHWLGRRIPKEDWTAAFVGIQYIRRSRVLVDRDAHKVDPPWLFLSPVMFDEVLLIQYLLSRSHKAGGLTFEGRMTLQDLFHRLRGGGYLRAMGVTAGGPSDALEQLMELLAGEGRVKFHYVLDRREFLNRLAALKDAKPPKPKIS